MGHEITTISISKERRELKKMQERIPDNYISWSTEASFRFTISMKRFLLKQKKKFFFSSFLYEQFSDFSRDYINSRNEMIRERSFRRDSKCRQIATPFTISFFIVLERFYRSSNSRLDLR